MTFWHQIAAWVISPFVAVAGLFSSHAPTNPPTTAAVAPAVESSASTTSAVPRTSQAAQKKDLIPQPKRTEQEKAQITCGGKSFSPCTGDGIPVCLDDGSNAYCRPPAPPMSQVTNQQAPVQPSGTYCNGQYWSNCPAGQQLICPTTGRAYCEDPEATAALDAYNKALQAREEQMAQQQADRKAKDQQAEYLYSEYLTKIAALDQQILDIKTKYYQDMQTAESRAAVLFQLQAEQAQLTRVANNKIDMINLQKEQLRLDYLSRIQAL